MTKKRPNAHSLVTKFPDSDFLSMFDLRRIHLGRMPSECYFFRVQTVAKPSRTILDEIKKVSLPALQAKTSGPLHAIRKVTRFIFL